MATAVRYGPYAVVSASGFPAGTEHAWSFGPWPWYADVPTVSAHPLHREGLNRAMTVLSSSLRVNGSGDRFLDCRIRVIGPDPVNYAIWLGVIEA